MQKEVNINDLKAYLGKCKRPVLDQLIRLTSLPKTGYKLDLRHRLEKYLDGEPSQIFITALLRFKNSGNIGDIIHANLRVNPNVPPSKTVPSKPPVPKESQSIKWHNNNSNFKLTDSVNLPTSKSFLKVPARLDDITFENNPFYKPIDTLVSPSILVPNYGLFSPGRNSYEKAINLNLSQDVAEAITYHLNMTATNQVEFTVQVILRFTVFDELECQKIAHSQSDVLDTRNDDLPVYLGVTVNGKSVNLAPLLPCKKPGMDGRRDGRPVNITPHLRLSPFFRNLIQINWSHNYDAFKYHYFGVYLMVKQNPDELSTSLTKTSLLDIDRSKARIIKQLSATNTAIEYEDDDLCIMDPDNADEDCVIPSSNVPIKILCPLTMSRLTIPVRGQKCKHIQCFDAHTYLKINELKPKWHCPICAEETKYQDLIVDDYFRSIISNSSLPKDVDTIIFDNEAHWTFEIEEDEGESKKEESSERQLKCDPDSNLNQVDDSGNRNPHTVDDNVIDLTESDDEQSYPPPNSAEVNLINEDSFNDHQPPSTTRNQECLASPDSTETLHKNDTSKLPKNINTEQELDSFIRNLLARSRGTKNNLLTEVSRNEITNKFLDSLILKNTKRNERDSLTNYSLPPKRQNLSFSSESSHKQLDLDKPNLEQQFNALRNFPNQQQDRNPLSSPTFSDFSADKHLFTNAKKLTNLFEKIQPSPQLQLSNGLRPNDPVDNDDNDSIEIIDDSLSGGEMNATSTSSLFSPMSPLQLAAGGRSQFPITDNPNTSDLVITSISNSSAKLPIPRLPQLDPKLPMPTTDPKPLRPLCPKGVPPTTQPSLSQADIIRLIAESAKNTTCLPQLPSWFKTTTSSTGSLMNGNANPTPFSSIGSSFNISNNPTQQIRPPNQDPFNLSLKGLDNPTKNIPNNPFQAHLDSLNQ